MTYAEKLKDPRWQKLRLEIMQRDNFVCQGCHRSDQTLHVHHKVYHYGNDPWEYKPDALITYCWQCHEVEEGNKAKFNDLVHDLLLMGFDYERLVEHIFKLT